MAYIAGKSLTGAKFINKDFDIERIGQIGQRFSKFTIYSELFVAQTMRLKNFLRFTYHLI